MCRRTLVTSLGTWRVGKSLDSFDFKVIASLNKVLTMELARCEFIDKRQNVIALGPSGTGKTHVALGLGLAACQKGLKVRFTTAAAHRRIPDSDQWEAECLLLTRSRPSHRWPICPSPGYRQRKRPAFRERQLCHNARSSAVISCHRLGVTPSSTALCGNDGASVSVRRSMTSLAPPPPFCANASSRTAFPVPSRQGIRSSLPISTEAEFGRTSMNRPVDVRCLVIKAQPF